MQSQGQCVIHTLCSRAKLKVKTDRAEPFSPAVHRPPPLPSIPNFPSSHSEFLPDFQSYIYADPVDCEENIFFYICKIITFLGSNGF